MTTTRLFELAAPVSAGAHVVDSGRGMLLLVPNGSRVYEVDAETAAAVDRARRADGDQELVALLRDLGLQAAPYIDDAPPETPPVRALSLAVAQKCNLGCTYCYAQQGSFGGPARQMDDQTALDAVELLFADASPGERFNLSFLGGEPLLNRPAIHAATERARALAAERDATVTFSITTNGTQLTNQDADFFEAHGFAVTVSLDGVGAVNDALRPFTERSRELRHGAAASEAPARAPAPHASFRTCDGHPLNLSLRATLDEFVALGFHSVGFSPLLRSPAGEGEMSIGGLGRCSSRWSNAARSSSAAWWPAGVTLRQHGQRTAGDPPGHPPPLSVRRRRRLPGRLGRGATRRVSPVRRRRGRRHGRPGERGRPRAPGAVAPRPPRPSPGAVSSMLGALHVRRRLPPRGDPQRPAGVRLHPGLVALLPLRLRAATHRPA